VAADFFAVSNDVPLARLHWGPCAAITSGCRDTSCLFPAPGSADASCSPDRGIGTRQGRLLVVVAADALDAQRLVDEIPYFDPALAVRPADWETLPYDTLSPHQDLVSDAWRPCSG